MVFEIVKKICELQPKWSSENTAEMKKRGELVRGEFTDFISSMEPKLSKALGMAFHDISFEGKDGVGRKTDVPWSRFYSKSRSKSATQGWYVVYLFPTDGKGVYICLEHGSSRLENGSFVPRTDSELKQLSDWGYSAVQHLIQQDTNIITSINLNSKLKLAQSYEKSVVVAKYYSIDNFPSPQEFERDACYFAELLGQLYFDEEMGRSPEQDDAIVALAKSASSSPKAGQGFNLTGPERKVVELQAMEVAKKYLENSGYAVEDLSANNPFDYAATKAGKSIPVEVKGTTSNAGSIVLTRNEVELHKNAYPDNMLLVVSNIDLNRNGNKPTASGGQLHIHSPWFIDESQLKVISYEYSI